MRRATATELRLPGIDGFEVENDGHWTTPLSLGDVKEKQRIRILKRISVIISQGDWQYRVEGLVHVGKGKDGE